jgi:very-short-patch-repair endonuclease
MSTRLVIELDDASHERSDRKDRDEFLERALKAAGVPLLRVPRGTRNVYQREVVAARIRQAIS